MTDKIVLKVNGKSFEGWTATSVVKSISQMAGAFGLTTTDIYPGRPSDWKIVMGDECSVEIDNQKVITGYIEDILINYDERTHDIQFGGRDKTGDLIDCSFDSTEKEWSGLTVKAVIEKVCQPFGISIVVDNSVSSAVNQVWPDNLKANEGETVFDMIMKVGNMKGFLPISYSDGKLTLTRSGTGYKCKDALITGVNILSGGLDQSNKDRFQTYIVKGQGIGDDDKSILPIFTSPTGRATDDIIKRYRPTIIFTETACDAGRCLERAKWEMNTRAGKSRSLNYTVQGWTQSDGKIWPLNSMVQIKDTKMGINSTLLISDLEFKVSEQGTVTKMRLVHPDTFSTNSSTVKIKTGFDFSAFGVN